MIVVYGTVCLDRLRQVPHLPGPGGYVEIQSERLALGGEAANTCAALRQWGARCALAGNSLGAGPEAALVWERLAETGLDDALIPERDHPAPFCDIYVTPDGERTMFGQGFAEMDLRHGLELIPWEKTAWLALDDNHGPAAREAMKQGAAKGVKVYALDFCRPNEPLTPDMMWQSSTVWSGTRNDPRRSKAWLSEFVSRYGCSAILTDGPRGFYFASPRHDPELLPSFPCPNPVDSTGAGDAFRAGMLYGLQQGWALGACLSFASASGALSCTRLGGAANAPTLAEIQSHISAHPEIAAKHSGF
jgi:sugar/nucleoside kinase (ribokinase family)